MSIPLCEPKFPEINDAYEVTSDVFVLSRRQDSWTVHLGNGGISFVTAIRFAIVSSEGVVKLVKTVISGSRNVVIKSNCEETPPWFNIKTDKPIVGGPDYNLDANIVLEEGDKILVSHVGSSYAIIGWATQVAYSMVFYTVECGGNLGDTQHLYNMGNAKTAGGHTSSLIVGSGLYGCRSGGHYQSLEFLDNGLDEEFIRYDSIRKCGETPGPMSASQIEKMRWFLEPSDINYYEYTSL